MGNSNERSSSSGLDPEIRQALARGLVLPACPLALNGQRRLDERRQRALLRYYIAAGAGGVAVGVHTTQFAIRKPEIGLFEPLLGLAAEELDNASAEGKKPVVKIGGICGGTAQASAEASLLRFHKYHVGLLSLAALPSASDHELLAHCREIAAIIPLFGFYLQPAVGGRLLSSTFWRRFAEIENVVAIKIAPFNRYQTLDVVRAVTAAGRDDIALYTGNDDNIVLDLVTPFAFPARGVIQRRVMVGGLLGHWSVWTRAAVELLQQCQESVRAQVGLSADLLQRSVEVTDANSAFFDTAHHYAGCIPGLHEVLRRQGLLENTLCLDPDERLSPGQREEIDRVYQQYPHLNDDAFVAQHRDQWLR